MQKRKLPNATAVLILGIFSILTCCCYGVVGLALGIVALVLAKKDIALYKSDPELYSDYSNLNTGRILAIIGIVLSTIYLLITVFSFVFYGSEAMQQMQNDMIKKIEQRQ